MSSLSSPIDSVSEKDQVKPEFTPFLARPLGRPDIAETIPRMAARKAIGSAPGEPRKAASPRSTKGAGPKRILDAAVRLFVASGYERTTMGGAERHPLGLRRPHRNAVKYGET